MKTFFTTLIIFSTTTLAFAQDNYPIPEKTPTRLFYIQHSNNSNTFVYDANIINNTINKEKPINEYRILYTEDGAIKPLTGLQKRMAYGLTIDFQSPTLYKMYLEASKKIPFFLTLDSNSKPIVYITVNNNKMLLDRIFVKLKGTFSLIHTEVDYILFEGKDFVTKQDVSEKYVISN
ncbi:DUF4833 domain-containing protein [Xanthomarina sp. GH4-25]|uniref:DUF4833 domain-containing protein n=1 Tax=Xanthomarina sp. GH4-25 TaxID=3349335 RepID=UPI000D674615|nr:DUF4833 domain-containing protein [Flavobacteriaceae bacterium LYZ1037]